MASEKLLKVADMAKLLGVSVRTIWRLRDAGVLPPAVRFGRSVRWANDTLEEWIARGGAVERPAGAAEETRQRSKPAPTRRRVRS